MKKLAGCLCCLVFLYVSQLYAQVPAVLGVWEFDKQASTLPEGFPLAEFQVNGTTTQFTYSETVIDDRSVNIVAKFNGQVNNTGTRSISADGQTMTIDVKAIFPDGQEIPFQLIFRRL